MISKQLEPDWGWASSIPRTMHDVVPHRTLGELALAIPTCHECHVTMRMDEQSSGLGVSLLLHLDRAVTCVGGSSWAFP